MNPFLFDLPILPEGFKFPDQYLRLVKDNALPDIEPWAFLFQNKGASLSYYGAMLQKFPDAPLVPFAVVNDQSGLYNEGWVVLSCFDGRDKSGKPRVYIYDYSRPPKKLPSATCYNDFSEWLSAARSDSERYKAERA